MKRAFCCSNFLYCNITLVHFSCTVKKRNEDNSNQLCRKKLNYLRKNENRKKNFEKIILCKEDIFNFQKTKILPQFFKYITCR